MCVNRKKKYEAYHGEAEAKQLLKYSEPALEGQTTRMQLTVQLKEK